MPLREQNPCQTVSKVPVIPGYIVIAEGQHGEAAVEDLLDGLVVVGNLRTEVDVDKEGVLPRRSGNRSPEGKGEDRSFYGAIGSHPGKVRFPGEIQPGLCFLRKFQCLRRLRHPAVFLRLQNLQHLLPGQQGREAECGQLL